MSAAAAITGRTADEAGPFLEERDGLLYACGPPAPRDLHGCKPGEKGQTGLPVCGPIRMLIRRQGVRETGDPAARHRAWPDADRRTPHTGVGPGRGPLRPISVKRRLSAGRCRVPCAEARGRRDRCAAPAREPPRGAMLSPGCYGVEHAPQLSDRIARGGCFAMCVS